MTKFKIGDKVRIKKVLGAINHETNKPFKKNDITTVTGIITDYHVRVGHGLNHQCSGNVMYVENLELVMEEKKEYTEEDIYEGMVLECVENNTSFWTVGKQYLVDKNLFIYDGDGDAHVDSDIASYLNSTTVFCTLNFKVVEPEEEQVIDDKLTHLNSIVITVPKKDSSGSYVNYNGLLDTLSTNNLIVNLSICDRLVSVNESVVYINFEVLHEDLVFLAKTINFSIKKLRNLNQTKIDLKLNGQHFVLDTQEEMDYSTTLINGLIGNV
ncbi:MAG: hypothetical protein RR929_00135 [Erysipelotrichaceae bacterium]